MATQTEQILTIDSFNGGISSGSKIGIKGSFQFGQGLNIHDDPDRLQIMPVSTKDSGTTVTDLPLFATPNTVNSNLYFLGDTGNVYKRTSAGTWSKLGDYTAGQGMGFFSGTNMIYFTDNNTQYTLNPATDDISSHRDLNSANYHPVESFLDKVFTGNGRELISTDASGIDYDSDTVGGGITIDFNYQIRCLKNIGSWLFIGATSDNSSDARYFLWDGYSEDYNYSRSLKGEDGINAVEIADDGSVLIFAGKQGRVYQLTGVDSPLTKLKQIPRIGNDKTIEIYPGSTANYQGHALFGLSTGTSATAEKGAYSWTSTDRNYSKVLNLDYAISTGTTTGTSLKIGALLAANTTELFIGWKDDTTYGVDLVDGTGVQATAVYESLIHDNSTPYRRKHYSKFKVKLSDKLATGEVITLSYKADRGSWVKVGTIDYSVDGDVIFKLFKPDVKAYELEIKLEFANASSTAPEVDNVIVEFVDEPLI